MVNATHWSRQPSAYFDIFTSSTATMIAISVLLVGVAANVLAVKENYYDVVILGGGFSGIGEAHECFYRKTSWNSFSKVRSSPSEVF